MTESPTLTYNKLIIEANRLGRLMKILDEAASHDMEVMLDDLYDGELNKLAEELSAIGTVLAMLRETPNAYINPEAMAAFHAKVEEAAAIEQLDWSKAILEAEITF